MNFGDGSKGYFVTSVDYASDATLAFALASKAEQVDFFKKVWAFSQAQTGRRMRSLLMDNAGEDLSREMRIFWSGKGLQQRLTHPSKTERQNARIEHLSTL